MSSGRWLKHTHAGVMTSVLMSSSRSSGSTSDIFNVSVPASWRRISSRSLVRKSTRRSGDSRTTRRPSAVVWISGFMTRSGARVLDQHRDALSKTYAMAVDRARRVAPVIQHLLMTLGLG